MNEPESRSRVQRETASRNEISAFQSFQAQLRSGDAEAAQKLFDDYSKQLVRLAHTNIHPALLKRFDGEDIVQSVFRTFFRRQEEGKFQIEHAQQLWQLLVTLTLYKTRSHARRHTAERRDAQAEQAFTLDDNLLAGQALPEDALALWEEIELVLDGLPDRAAEILAMRLSGNSKTEIAVAMDLSRQTVHRILKLVDTRLKQRFEQFAKDQDHDG